MEQFTRFILERGHYSSNGVKFRAFLPRAENPKKSVFCIDGLSEEAIWDCARWVEEQFTNPDSSEVRARGDFLRGAVQEAGLALEPDAKPHPCHWNIVGWPAEKEQRTAKAQWLASKATLVVRPETNP